uniref:Uncharacterized protein n=1 Tax=Arundo donax TaxID=35708 RepID=A0A0A8Y5F8_ARUDO
MMAFAIFRPPPAFGACGERAMWCRQNLVANSCCLQQDLKQHNYICCDTETN